jgi:hypothetical protein
MSLDYLKKIFGVQAVVPEEAPEEQRHRLLKEFIEQARPVTHHKTVNEIRNELDLPPLDEKKQPTQEDAPAAIERPDAEWNF